MSCSETYLSLSFTASNLSEGRSSAFVIYLALSLCTYFFALSNKVIKILFLMKYSYPRKCRKWNKYNKYIYVIV